MLPEIELKKSHLYHKAFSVLELSIVIAVISLLLLLVSQGAKFIETTNLKSIYNEAIRYQLAVTKFREKYNFLPGDFPHSDQFFKHRCSTIPDNCNGDGDGLIKTINSAEKNSAGYSEPLLFWRHLALAGYVKGSYSGKAQEIVASRDCDSYYLCCTQKDCPISDYNQGTYSYYSWHLPGSSETQCGLSAGYYPNNINILHFGKYIKGGNNLNSVISAEKAYLIDVKYDDAMPTKGLIQVRSGADVTTSDVGPCIINNLGVNMSNNNAYGQNYLYNFSLTGDQCVISFIDSENSSCSLP
jgi:prepilin-type N-terminal cleavage/methylation domain-containing protein